MSIGKILGSHSSENYDYSRLQCDTVQFGTQVGGECTTQLTPA